jgi:tetratricopeptide (TPR) repeat protein
LKIPFEKDLIRAISLTLTFSIVLAKLLSGKTEIKRPRSYYEAMYEKETEYAFEAAPSKRKRLFDAIKLYHEGKYDKAEKTLTKLFRASEEKADIRAAGLFLGLVHTQKKNFYGAIRIYESVVAADPNYSRIYSNLGYVYSETGRNDKAMENYLRAIDTDPSNAKAYNNIAGLCFEEGRFEEAEEYAKKALDAEPSLYQASTLLAIIYTAKGQSEEAESYFRRSVASGQDAALLRRTMERHKTK